MNTKLIKLLTIACAVLGVIIVGEWLYASYAKRQMLLSIQSGAATPYQADKLPELNLAQQTEESYVDLAARPLFIEGRRPVAEPEVAGDGSTAESGSFDWQLDGIYSDKKRTSALFSGTKKTGAKYESLKLTTGDEVQGWRLAEIRQDGVTLEKDGNRKDIMLRKPKLKESPPERRKPANVPQLNAKTPENTEPANVPQSNAETPENNENE